MTPTEFTFQLTVPRDPRLADVVRQVAQHAVSYAQVDESVAEGFLDRVGALATRRLAAAGAAVCHLEYGCEDGVLYVKFDGETVKSN